MDVDVQTARAAVDTIVGRFDRLVEKGRMTAESAAHARDGLRIAPDVSALRECDVLIEAVVERLDVKQAVLSKAIDVVSDNTILATNTSSLSVSELGQRLDVGRRIVGMHFFNPAPLMPLVEIIAGRDTDTAVVDTLFDIAARWGKSPVRVRDTPGFIVNRVARPYYLEALRTVEAREADPASVDLIMKEIGGFKMGPFELMDLVGIDVNYAVTCSVYEQSGKPVRFTPSEIQAQLVQNNQLGRKTGVGFYSYRGERPELSYRLETTDANPGPQLRDAWTRMAAAIGVDIATESGCVFGRILCAIMNEAALAAAEGVATDADIDLAMRLGTNYPKGPLAWAQEIGPEHVGRFLLACNADSGDDRFTPAPRFTL
jgi:3-hydroxybutyryl-CoA dehydrogenase